MHKHPELTEARIERVRRRLLRNIWRDPEPLAVEVCVAPEPIPFREARASTLRPIALGEHWGDGFDCAWFRLCGCIPERMAGLEVVALVDVGGEGCVVDDAGQPRQGLTPRFDDRHGELIGPKREVRLADAARGAERVTLWVEAGANHIAGRQRGGARLAHAELAVRDSARWTLYHELSFVEALLHELPRASRRRALLLRAANDACNHLYGGAPDDLEAARAALAPELARPAAASALTVTAIGHAHTDVAWLWPMRETVRKCARSWSTALRLMERYPDYRFGASQPALYAMVERHYPALFAEIRAAVKVGRWELQGGMWVEADCNLPSGESLVRQFLYGQRFYREAFGVEVDNLWLPDVFGYPAALPTIMRGCGIRYFTTHKLNWNQFNRFPHHSCYWRGLDGSEVFAHFQVNDYNVAATPAELRRYETEHLDNDRVDHALCLFGMGDGGGGPGPTHLEWLQLARDIEGLPRIRLEHARRFFHEAEASARDLQTWQGELYFEYHRGTYTTEARIKRMNRHLELALRETELVHALGPLDGYPAARLDGLWRRLLTLQFHDILPGSSIQRVHEETHAEHDSIAAEVAALLDDGEARLAQCVDTRGAECPLIVRNSLSWDRSALVALAASEVPASGAGQRVQGAHGPEVLLRLQAPALGHAVVDLAAPEPAPPGTLSVDETHLENALLRVALAADGTLARVHDKIATREVLDTAGGGNRLCLYDDLPVRYDAWDIDRYYLEQTPVSAALVGRRVVETGPLRAAIEQTFEGAGYRIVQRIELEADARVLVFDTWVDWHASEQMLRAEFPVNVRASTARYEMQFGHVERPTHGNTSWDWARFEGVAHRWADLSQPDYGITLVNDCKYGHRIEDSTISLNLLRAPKFPDTTADMGVHRFRYGLIPHQGDHRDGEAVRQGYAFNVPLRTLRASPAPAPAPAPAPGTLPARWSLARPNARNVVVDTVKRAESGDALVLRCYEAEGADGRAALQLGFEPETVERVNLLEAEARPAAVGRDAASQMAEIPLQLAPFEIATIKSAPRDASAPRRASGSATSHEETA